MIKPNECVIIGGGTSINEGIVLGLKDILKDKFVIACNYAFKFFPHTLTCFVDRDFYYPSQSCLKNKTHPFIYDELKKEPLIIGYDSCGVSEFKLPNTILLRGTGQYNIRPLNKGFYHPYLCGIYALSLAQFLLNYSGNIYLLGFDWTMRKKEDVDPKNYKKHDPNTITHFYSDKEVNHNGQHYLSAYENHDPDYYFKNFKEPNINIYNVSMQSNIHNFKKIGYTDFIIRLNKKQYSQDNLREYINLKLDCRT